MTWNYRLVRYTHASSGALVGLVEVYYDAHGVPNGYAPADLVDWDNEDDLRAMLDQLRAAMDAPRLDVEVTVVDDLRRVPWRLR